MANIQEGIRQSLDVIRTNKGRAFLTMLGINFGVMSLVAISVIGLSFRSSVSSIMSQYGSELVWIMRNDGAYASGEPRTSLDSDDLAYFRRTLPGILHLTTFFARTGSASYRGETQDTVVYGVNADYFRIFAASKEIETGRALLPEDEQYRRAVCVIGPDLAGLLFGDENPLGKYVKLFDRVFLVVGITKWVEQGTVFDGTDNSTVFVPEPFVSSLFYQGMEKKYMILLLKFDSIASVDSSLVRIENYLTKKYGTIRGEERFRVLKLDTYIQVVNSVLDTVSILILVIAAISLLVGGLGIMNIMLVTVTERTQEIGVRRAVGARRRDILVQFLIEAVTLCLVGGGIGVILGLGLAALVCLFAGWPFVLSLLSVAVGLAVSTAIGLLFGIYPAWKASKLTPIEALRVEV